MSGTDTPYYAIGRYACSAMPGTDIAYRPTRVLRNVRYLTSIWCYQGKGQIKVPLPEVSSAIPLRAAMRCPVLTYARCAQGWKEGMPVFFWV
eukprot:3758302-Rhodomonas_salina.1